MGGEAGAYVATAYDVLMFQTTMPSYQCYVNAKWLPVSYPSDPSPVEKIPAQPK
jgi:hypothetical protein